MVLQIKDNNGNWISIPAIQGASAYDVAVKNGFEGSEEEWLASLKGSGEGGSVDLTGYATETYVTQKIAEAQLSGGEVDLSAYVTSEELVEAVDSALTDAKESGKFTGPQGEPGEKGEKGDTGAAGEDGADGYTPVKGTDYWTAEDQAAIISDVLAALPVAEEVSV